MGQGENILIALLFCSKPMVLTGSGNSHIIRHQTFGGAEQQVRLSALNLKLKGEKRNGTGDIR
jgi:hypothetical protein